ncbi:proliferation marker protein Ki-67-like [Culicoides brevitarsis]|uniref:proliferation marker protein Ki-67-like n=1 Tax=Culicoides brevitarsis TaxID=469753 RepID=UPI00307C84E5
MSLAGKKLVILKHDGQHGVYETKEPNITIGGSIANDVRIKLPEADPYICKIELDTFGRPNLTNLSGKQVLVNGNQVKQKVFLKNGDNISILNKNFQWLDSSFIQNKNTPSKSNVQPKILSSSVPSFKTKAKSKTLSVLSKCSKRITFYSLKPTETDQKGSCAVVIDSINREMFYAEKENSAVNSKLNMSGTMIVSYASTNETTSKQTNHISSDVSCISDVSSDVLKLSSMYLIDLNATGSICNQSSPIENLPEIKINEKNDSSKIEDSLFESIINESDVTPEKPENEQMSQPDTFKEGSNEFSSRMSTNKEADDIICNQTSVIEILSEISTNEKNDSSKIEDSMFKSIIKESVATPQKSANEQIEQTDALITESNEFSPGLCVDKKSDDSVFYQTSLENLSEISTNEKTDSSKIEDSMFKSIIKESVATPEKPANEEMKKSDVFTTELNEYTPEECTDKKVDDSICYQTSPIENLSEININEKNDSTKMFTSIIKESVTTPEKSANEQMKQTDAVITESNEYTPEVCTDKKVDDNICNQTSFENPSEVNINEKNDSSKMEDSMLKSVIKETVSTPEKSASEQMKQTDAFIKESNEFTPKMCADKKDDSMIVTESWINTVMSLGCSTPMAPNTKTQILSERYSNITTDSVQINDASHQANSVSEKKMSLLNMSVECSEISKLETTNINRSHSTPINSLKRPLPENKEECTETPISENLTSMSSRSRRGTAKKVCYAESLLTKQSYKKLLSDNEYVNEDVGTPNKTTDSNQINDSLHKENSVSEKGSEKKMSLLNISVECSEISKLETTNSTPINSLKRPLLVNKEECTETSISENLTPMSSRSRRGTAKKVCYAESLLTKKSYKKLLGDNEHVNEDVGTPNKTTDSNQINDSLHQENSVSEKDSEKKMSLLNISVECSEINKFDTTNTNRSHSTPINSSKRPLPVNKEECTETPMSENLTPMTSRSRRGTAKKVCYAESLLTKQSYKKLLGDNEYVNEDAGTPNKTTDSNQINDSLHKENSVSEKGSEKKMSLLNISVECSEISKLETTNMNKSHSTPINSSKRPLPVNKEECTETPISENLTPMSSRSRRGTAKKVCYAESLLTKQSYKKLLGDNEYVNEDAGTPNKTTDSNRINDSLQQENSVSEKGSEKKMSLLNISVECSEINKLDTTNTKRSHSTPINSLKNKEECTETPICENLTPMSSRSRRGTAKKVCYAESLLTKKSYKKLLSDNIDEYVNQEVDTPEKRECTKIDDSQKNIEDSMNVSTNKKKRGRKPKSNEDEHNISQNISKLQGKDTQNDEVQESINVSTIKNRRGRKPKSNEEEHIIDQNISKITEEEKQNDEIQQTINVATIKMSPKPQSNEQQQNISKSPEEENQIDEIQKTINVATNKTSPNNEIQKTINVATNKTSPKPQSNEQEQNIDQNISKLPEEEKQNDEIQKTTKVQTNKTRRGRKPQSNEEEQNIDQNISKLPEEEKQNDEIQKTTKVATNKTRRGQKPQSNEEEQNIDQNVSKLPEEKTQTRRGRKPKASEDEDQNVSKLPEEKTQTEEIQKSTNVATNKPKRGRKLKSNEDEDENVSKLPEEKTQTEEIKKSTKVATTKTRRGRKPQSNEEEQNIDQNILKLPEEENQNDEIQKTPNVATNKTRRVRKPKSNEDEDQNVSKLPEEKTQTDEIKKSTKVATTKTRRGRKQKSNEDEDISKLPQEENQNDEIQKTTKVETNKTKRGRKPQSNEEEQNIDQNISKLPEEKTQTDEIQKSTKVATTKTRRGRKPKSNEDENISKLPEEEKQNDEIQKTTNVATNKTRRGRKPQSNEDEHNIDGDKPSKKARLSEDKEIQKCVNEPEVVVTRSLRSRRK